MDKLLPIIYGIAIAITLIFCTISYDTGQNTLIHNFCTDNKNLTLTQRDRCIERLQEFK
jgi:hypothetical protein